ncbi:MULTISPECIES: DUF2759 domain-containing protein [Heyndrickxia]|uniref:DUF2759 domain-containing protein n=1 Tax=Heyndrickxia TaxID=2837504 RepID=UPI0009F81771|nr:DUF2759 domain-containing protein [Heyndrickxia shackletonii]MBB2482181.1 DUF2759 domain-containing protein [Bacillus sp. APMAM]NEY99626.1 DUF2759 domain-containing protein [Heyndrickxia shackletonii]RTZ54523.1 DUF2759 domain-containing protein [Bacillus sp. SAJ1]
MGTVIIFALVTLLALFAVFKTIKNRNPLGFIWAILSVLVFGFFTVMTVINSGYPATV